MGQLGNIKISIPTFSEILPSTGKKIKFSPFRVGDEKTLLIASQSEDRKDMLRALKSIVGNCVTGATVDEMETYDIEYLFLKLRAKSVGETSDIGVSCTNCEEYNSITVDLEAVIVEKQKNHTDIVKINDDLGFKMKTVDLEEIDGLDLYDPEDSIEIVVRSVKQVFNGEEVIDVEPADFGELKELIESMTSDQYSLMQEYFRTSPKLSKKIDFVCGSCGHENEQTLEGLSSFF